MAWTSPSSLATAAMTTHTKTTYSASSSSTRVYHVLTPASHAVRLLRMTYVDSASGKKQTMRYAFVQEDPGATAERLHGRLLKLTGAKSDDLEPVHDATVGVFQYMIGNTHLALGAVHSAERSLRRMVSTGQSSTTSISPAP